MSNFLKNFFRLDLDINLKFFSDIYFWCAIVFFIATTLFLVKKANEAIREIDGISKSLAEQQYFIDNLHRP